MTRNQKMAIEILRMLDSGMNASVEYYAESDKVAFWHHYNDFERTVTSINIYKETNDTVAQGKFDEIKSVIEEMKSNAD